MRGARQWSRVAVAAAALGAVPAIAGAQVRTFAAFLTNENETPVAAGPLTIDGTATLRPKSFGFATFVLNAAHTQLSMTAVIRNIDFGAHTGVFQTTYDNDNLVNAHIHASNGAPAANGTRPVVWGFIGNPFHNTLPGNTTIITPLVGQVGAIVQAIWDAGEGGNGGLSGNLANLIEGRNYINFHTRQFTGGEIRAVIFATPEPSTYALMATGLGALGFLARRRRAA